MRMRMRVRVRVRMRMRARVRVRVCVCVIVRGCAEVQRYACTRVLVSVAWLGEGPAAQLRGLR